MICFCGDSYVEDHKKFGLISSSPLPLQWHRIIAEKLYGDNYGSSYKNYGKGGSSIDHLIEQQLIKKVLPLYPSNPLKHLVVGITYNERFSISEHMNWYIGMPVEDEDREMFDENIKFRLKYDNDFMKRRGMILNTLFHHLEKFGTKIFVFNVDAGRDYYVDEKFYFQKKAITNYFGTITNKLQIENHYPNHMTVKINQMIGESLYNEIVKRN